MKSDVIGLRVSQHIFLRDWHRAKKLVSIGFDNGMVKQNAR